MLLITLCPTVEIASRVPVVVEKATGYRQLRD